MSPSLRKSGVKKIIALTHGHEVWWARIFPFNFAIKRIGKSVDHLTYLGEFTRQAISKALSRKSATEMVKIAPGIDTAHFIPQPDAMQKRKELGLQDKKIIISVGRLVHRKGQDNLIQAMPAVLKKIPNAHLPGNSGGAPDAVLEGVTGLCVDGTNIEQITGAIVEICRDAERASHMGAAGRNWIVDQWRWEIWSKEFNALLVEQ